MAEAVYIQRGESIDHTNVTAAVIRAGDVVMLGTHIGVAGSDIPPGAVGALHIEGVFALPTTATFAQGADVYWDGTAAVNTGSDAIGWAVAMSVGVVHVRLGG